MIAKDRSTLGSCIAAAALVALLSGTAVAQPANLSATRVTAERSLAGYKAMSVDVDGTGSFADQRGFMGVMEEQLRSFGVAILTPGALPVLRLRVGHQAMTGPGGAQLLYTLRLEFEQLVTLAGSPARQAAAVTWQSSELVGLNSLGIERRGVVQVLNEFGGALQARGRCALAVYHHEGLGAVDASSDRPPRIPAVRARPRRLCAADSGQLLVRRADHHHAKGNIGRAHGDQDWGGHVIDVQRDRYLSRQLPQGWRPHRHPRTRGR